MSREAEAEAKEANRERGVEIVEALDRYKQDNGRFPEELGVLVPTYLVEVPETTRGESFDYEPDELEGYYLCFYLNRRKTIGCCYNDRLEFWDCFRNYGD